MGEGSFREKNRLTKSLKVNNQNNSNTKESNIGFNVKDKKFTPSLKGINIYFYNTFFR